MIYNKDILGVKLTEVISRYISQGYYIIPSEYINLYSIMIKKGDVKIGLNIRDEYVAKEHYIRELYIRADYLEHSNKTIDHITGIYMTSRTDGKLIYSDDFDEILNIAKKVEFRNKYCMIEKNLTYIQHLSKTNIPGFKRGGIIKKIEYDDGTIRTFLMNENRNKQMELYCKNYCGNSYVGYEIEKLMKKAS